MSQIICADNGITYANISEMRSVSFILGHVLNTAYNGPCKGEFYCVYKYMSN